MCYALAIQWYHSQADLMWMDGPFKNGRIILGAELCPGSQRGDGHHTEQVGDHPSSAWHAATSGKADFKNTIKRRLLISSLVFFVDLL
jgi:hypothetical protein